MIELKDKRSLTAKHYFRDDGQLVFEGHQGHIHYDNKLGLGDGAKGLRGIDYTLLWDEKRRGWYFNYGSFNPFIPEYADQTSTFRDIFQDKDQMVSYTPDCQHVKGRFIKEEDLSKEGLSNETTGNCVIYDNAFGENIDLIYCFIRSGLKKLVRLRNGVEVKDYQFRFKVELPGKAYRGFSKNDISYELENRTKQFDTAKQLLVGEQVEGKEWATYIRPFKVWSRGKRPYEVQEETIKVDYVVEKDGVYLFKNIPASFIEKAYGDVFTDTTTSYYSGAGDGYVENSGATWSTIRNASSGSSVGYTGTLFGNYIGVGGSQYIWRGFVPIDTSGLGSGATISSASLYLSVQGKWATNQSGNSFLLVQTSQASNTALEVGDFDQCGSVNSPTEGADRITTASFPSSGYQEIPLNSTALTWISKTGYTKLGFRNSLDLSDTGPGNGDYGVYFYPSEQTGTSNDPYISVTYTAGATFSGKINIGDTFKSLTKGQINIGDSWKNITKAKINIGDTWKTIF